MKGSSALNGKTTLFIGDLASFCTEAHIRDAFSPYGNIQDIKIMRSEDSNRTLMYGFIKFTALSAATRALEEMHGKLLCGRALR